MIPTEVFERRVDAEGLRVLVQSAADANFNMLRIWGGGIYQCVDAFLLEPFLRLLLHV